MEQCLIKKEELQTLIQTVFEKDYEITAITRLLGGAQKGVYKVDCSNLFSCVLYIWDDSLSYFDASEIKEIFTSNSAILFERNYELLKTHGISVPKLYDIDRSKTTFPFEYALVEYIDGSDLESLLYNEKVDCILMLRDLRDNLKKVHSIKNPEVGDLRGYQDSTFCCEDYVKQSLECSLAYLFEHYEPIKELKEQLVKVSCMLYESIEKRKEYSFIHWELGPNHVMVDRFNKIYLIDIEGMKFFDIEYEYSFLQLRFGKYYLDVASLSVDPNRMKYYKFYHHISCIEGGCYLINQDYYDLSDAYGMVEYNYNELLTNYLS